MTGAPDAPAFTFRRAEACAMCGAGRSGFRLLGRRLDRHQGLLPRRREGVTVSVVRCGACGLVFPDPMPLPPSAAELYDVDPSTYWKEEYFHEDPGYAQGILSVARELLGDGGAARAVDVGAGVGRAMRALERGGFDVVGVEPSASFRALAVERMGIPESRIVPRGLEEAEFPRGSVDFVNMGAVLEHLPRPGRALERVAGWLRPGGVVHVEVPSAGWLLSRGLNLFYRLTLQGFVTNCSPMHRPYHLYEFTEPAFRAAAGRANLELVRIQRYVGDVYAPSLLRPALRALMERSRTGMQLAVWLRRR